MLRLSSITHSCVYLLVWDLAIRTCTCRLYYLGDVYLQVYHTSIVVGDYCANLLMWHYDQCWLSFIGNLILHKYERICVWTSLLPSISYDYRLDFVNNTWWYWFLVTWFTEMLLMHWVWFVIAVGECSWLMLISLKSFWITIVISPSLSLLTVQFRRMLMALLPLTFHFVAAMERSDNTWWMGLQVNRSWFYWKPCVFGCLYLCFPCFIQFGACVSPWSNRMKLDTGEEFMECTGENYVLALVSIMNGHWYVWVMKNLSHYIKIRSLPGMVMLLDK
jgi:hypothetical protein